MLRQVLRAFGESSDPDSPSRSLCELAVKTNSPCGLNPQSVLKATAVQSQVEIDLKWGMGKTY